MQSLISPHTNVKGFTLVELAIALMIIGLLIAGVLKGQELVENARITQVARQLHDYDVAVTAFRSIYNNQLPGDVLNPAERIPNCTTSPCNNTTSVGNGRIEGALKRANFWRHLQRAGLITGTNEGGNQNNTSPLNPMGGYTGINYFALGTPAPNPMRNRFHTSDPKALQNRVGPERSKAIDTKMDDGMPTSGTVQTLYNTAGWGADAHVCHDGTTFEYLTNPALLCVLTFNFGSLK